MKKPRPPAVILRGTPFGLDGKPRLPTPLQFDDVDYSYLLDMPDSMDVNELVDYLDATEYSGLAEAWAYIDGYHIDKEAQKAIRDATADYLADGGEISYYRMGEISGIDFDDWD